MALCLSPAPYRDLMRRHLRSAKHQVGRPDFRSFGEVSADQVAGWNVAACWDRMGSRRRLGEHPSVRAHLAIAPGLGEPPLTHEL